MGTLHPVFCVTPSEPPPGRDPAPVTMLGSHGHPSGSRVWFIESRNLTDGGRYVQGDLDAVVLQIRVWSLGHPHSIRLDSQYAKAHGLVSAHEFPADCSPRAPWPRAARCATVNG